MTRIFSYGTLQMETVQRALFGRVVAMADDVLLGYESVPIEIDDPDVIEFSGSTTHLALVPGAPDAAIAGKVLEVGDADFAAVDAYEGVNYRRVDAQLASGSRAWVYVKA